MARITLNATKASQLTPDLSWHELNLTTQLPKRIDSPAQAYYHFLTVQISADPQVSVVGGRLIVKVADVEGRVRIGFLRPDGSSFADQKVVNNGDNAEVQLNVRGMGENIGSLVFQNTRLDGGSSLTIVSVELQEGNIYPTERVDTPLYSYLRGGFNIIEGWCGYMNVLFLRKMDEVLTAHGVQGGVGEVGVHHGKFFVALLSLANPGSKSVALDVFGEQEFNLDSSGSGDRAIFDRNVHEWAPRPDEVVVVQGDSLVLGANERGLIRQDVGTMKFFSVDGCHSVEHTLADMETAISLLTPGGIVVLDDFLNPDFPEVHQAVAYMYLMGRPSLAPFAIGQNKLYMTHVSHQATYVAAARRVMESFPETVSITDVRYYGYPVLSWRSAEKGWEFPTEL